MALVKCEECGKQISDEAESCPSCGAKPEKMGFFRKLFIGLFVLFVIGSVMDGFNSPSTKPVDSSSSVETQEEKKKREEEYAKNVLIVLRISALREDMKNPQSFDLVEAINLKNGILCTTYRATNAFGAIVTESKAITKDGKIVDYAKNCNEKFGDDVTHLKKFLKKI
ncbi:zinc ribbon domain-containing protein [Limnohabitans sp. Rim28]|uniref:zinc ribbon domain-containing protein n=1 Tax=Limnohabitans sp. Rim28 TaxID=1100720 RepID=UPI000E31E1BC|nr:zinc ribbon domain-containing protein [Limnohabitans sp. Rim28]